MAATIGTFAGNSITNFEAYPEFLGEVVSAETQEGASKTAARVVFELEVVKRFTYTLDFKMTSTEVSWDLVDSNFFKLNSGKWTLGESADGTDVDYQLEVDFGFFVPKFVAKKLTEVNLPKMFDSFEKRAKELA